MLQSTTAAQRPNMTIERASRARRRPRPARAHREHWIAVIAGALVAATLATLVVGLPATVRADVAVPGLLALAASVVGVAVPAFAGARQRHGSRTPPDAVSALSLYQALVESVSDTLFALDADGRFLYASPTVLSLLGVSPKAILGRSFLDFIETPEVEQTREHALAFLRSNNDETRQRLLRMITIDGLVRYVEVRYGRPFAGDAEGAVVVGVLRDVSVTFAMTQRLREERQRLRSIVDASGAAILLVDRDLNIRLANQELKQLRRATGGAAGEGVVQAITAGLDPALLERWRAAPLSKDEAKPVRFACSLLDSEGMSRIYSITAKPVIGADRRLRQIIFLGVDDTERQAAERALYDADRLATLGEMAATVVHELRQPLQVIAIAGEAAREEAHDTELVVAKLARIDTQVERANRIIEDLRVFARGTGSERAQPFALAQAVRGAIGFTAAASRDAIMKVVPAIDDGMPPIMGHAPKLEQVLINLINNARDAGARALVISATLGRDEAGMPRIELAIDDDGPGIPPAVLPRLFNAFVTTKPSGKGTGLGLRICRRIVEEMGGSIAASNRPEGGARFAITLPAVT